MAENSLRASDSIDLATSKCKLNFLTVNYIDVQCITVTQSAEDTLAVPLTVIIGLTETYSDKLDMWI